MEMWERRGSISGKKGSRWDRREGKGDRDLVSVVIDEQKGRGTAFLRLLHVMDVGSALAASPVLLLRIPENKNNSRVLDRNQCKRKELWECLSVVFSFDCVLIVCEPIY
ncbi:unnamed protein product [Lactuca virosa]|uniref:Uncharacterized protein n=1 Tax=Lactuca virosa TaxID=75947 RepID=A0AAU9PEC3_9ASTR|nr:unnamed protein product [Lactuca virosa]